MDWDDLKYFIAVAETGSLTAAARRMGASVATTGRRIDALERDLGLRLVHRRSGGTVVTAAGQRLLGPAGNGADALFAVERLAATLREGDGRPPVRVSATEPVVADILAPSLPALWAETPEIPISLVSATRVANFTRTEADIAVRMFRPLGDSLIARRLPNIEMGCFAAPAYLRGREGRDIDLRRERLLVFDESYGDIAEVTWVRERGLENAVVLRSTSSKALLKAAAAGGGIAIAPRFLAENMGLVAVPAPRIPVRQCWMVSHADSKGSGNVAAVKAWIVRTMMDQLGQRRGVRPARA